MGEKIQPGEFPTAAEFNRHVDASEFVRRHLAFSNGTPRRGFAGDNAFVSVKNASGADRRQGEILEFNDLVLTDLTARHLILQGGAVLMANGFGILQSPVASTDYAPNCQIAGACVGLVNVVSTAHHWASPKKDSYVLESAPAGPVRILWKPAGTGEKTCAVTVSQDGTATVKPVADFSQGTSGDCQVWLNGADTGATVNLLALFADVFGGKYCVQWCGLVFPGEC